MEIFFLSQLAQRMSENSMRKILFILFFAPAAQLRACTKDCMVEKKDLKIIAHRGASKEAPENTLIAIKLALELGADFVEFDVRFTKDKIPVLYHDDFVHFGSSRILFHELDYKQIKDLDVGGKFSMEFAGERIPTLEEVLSLDAHAAGFMIEIKPSPHIARKDLEDFARLISKKGKGKKIAIGSFSKEIIKTLKEIEPKHSYLGITGHPAEIERFLETGVKHLAIWANSCSSLKIKVLHEKGIEVWTWTVDDPERAQELYRNGIDGIITNNVRDFLQLFKFDK